MRELGRRRNQKRTCRGPGRTKATCSRPVAHRRAPGAWQLVGDERNCSQEPQFGPPVRGPLVCSTGGEIKDKNSRAVALPAPARRPDFSANSAARVMYDRLMTLEDSSSRLNSRPSASADGFGGSSGRHQFQFEHSDAKPVAAVRAAGQRWILAPSGRRAPRRGFGCGDEEELELRHKERGRPMQSEAGLEMQFI